MAMSTTPAQTLGGTEARLRRSVNVRSGAIADTFAQEARRPEDEDQDQDEEREHVLIVAPEKTHGAILCRALLLHRVRQEGKHAQVRHIADVARAERLDDAQQKPAEHRAREVSD